MISSKVCRKRFDTDSQVQRNVFDPDGRYLGEVTVSDRIDSRIPIVSRGATMYYMTKDELDVPYIVRADIEGRN